MLEIKNIDRNNALDGFINRFADSEERISELEGRQKLPSLKCKELTNPGSFRPNDGSRGDGCSVLNAHQVTGVSFPGVALKGFHTATNSLELPKGKEVFKYLVLFLLWHQCDLH